MLDMFKKISFNFLQINKDCRDLINDTLTSRIFNFKRINVIRYIYIYLLIPQKDSHIVFHHYFITYIFHSFISFIYTLILKSHLQYSHSCIVNRDRLKYPHIYTYVD